MTPSSYPPVAGAPGAIVVGGEVLDVVGGTWRKADVRVENGRIVEIGSELDHTGTDRIDATGRFVVPGLIDGHVHLTAFSADFRVLERTAPSYVYAHTARIMRETLARGFTTAPDSVCSPSANLWPTRRRARLHGE